MSKGLEAGGWRVQGWGVGPAKTWEKNILGCRNSQWNAQGKHEPRGQQRGGQKPSGPYRTL